MSYKVVKLVLGADPEKLRPVMKRFVLTVLAEHAQHDGSEVRPGLPRLARMCGLSIDAVYRWRRLLRVEGWIICTRKATNTKPAIYRIDIKKLQDAAWAGLRSDSAAAQSQSTEVDSATAQSPGSAAAQSQNGLDSAAARSLDSAPAQTNPSPNRQVLRKGPERENGGRSLNSVALVRSDSEKNLAIPDEGPSLDELKTLALNVDPARLTPWETELVTSVGALLGVGQRPTPKQIANLMACAAKPKAEALVEKAKAQRQMAPAYNVTGRVERPSAGGLKFYFTITDRARR